MASDFNIKRSNWFYDFTIDFARFLCKYHYGSYTVIGKENVPQKGPVIVCPKHQYSKDLWLVGNAVMPYRLSFMAKQDLFLPGIGYILNKYGAFPVDRTVPKPSTLKYLESLLDNDEFVLIFPEGTRMKDKMGKSKFGISKFLMNYEEKNGKIIKFLPVGVKYVGDHNTLFKTGRGLDIQINIGEYLVSDKSINASEERADSLTTKIMKEIERLTFG